MEFQYGFQNDDYLFYVFEFAAGGMLFYHLRQEGRLTEPRARFYFGEIVLALDYLHSFGIVFRCVCLCVPQLALHQLKYVCGFTLGLLSSYRYSSTCKNCSRLRI